MRKSLILFGVLDDSDVDWLLRVASKRIVPNGSTLIREGVPTDSLYIVLSGAFEVFARGGKTPIARLLSGEVIGEMSFVDSRPPSATVIAEQDSWVLDLPREEVFMRLQDQPFFGGRFYRAIAVFLSSRVRDTVSLLCNGIPLRLDQSVEDASEIPEDLLDKMSIAGIRFSMLQERTRAVNSA
jgi:CRP-like cAMP-binding protein